VTTTHPETGMIGRLTPAVRMGLSIAAAVGVYGISFGALSAAAGLSVWQTSALSLLMFTGGSQFAFIAVIAGGGTGAAAWAAARDPWFLDTWPRHMAKPHYFGS